MSSTEYSERKRLYPVIATVLNLTQMERLAIEAALASDDDGAAAAGTAEIASTITSITSIATSSLESIFGKSSFFGSDG